MDHRLLCWIRLQQALGYGSNKPMEAYRRHPDLERWFSSRSFLENEEGLFTKREMERFQEFTGERCLKIAERATKLGQKMLTPDSREYPECLRQITNPPAVLYYVGEFPAVDDLPSIAVVGSRDTSQGGLAAVRILCRQLGAAGAVVVSGGAMGIDTAAHLGAMDTGGKTVALLACGIDYPYLKSNQKLREAIARHGALVSEFAPGTEVQKWHFLIRNRIISGLSCGVLVAEAAIKSGTMITAKHATEQDRDIFVLMVDSWRKNSEGVLQLIWDGAKPVSCAADILTEYTGRFPACTVPPREPISTFRQKPAEEEIQGLPTFSDLPVEPSVPKEESLSSLSPEAVSLYQSLTAQPVSAEELAYRLKIPVKKLFQAATELELSGKVQSFSGGRYAKKG